MVISILIACSTSEDIISVEELTSASTADASGQPDPSEEPDLDTEDDPDFEGEFPADEEEEERSFDPDACDEGVAASIGERTYGGLQAALDALGPNDEAVWVCPGVHTGPFYITANYEVVVLGAGDKPDETILTTTVSNVLNVFAWRGGQQGEPGRFFARNLPVMGGSAEQGGGISAAAQEVHLQDVIIRGGNATQGGGLYVDGGAVGVLLDSVEFYDNDAVRGGGFYIGGSEEVNHLEFRQVGFYENAATDAGGAAYFANGDVDGTFVGVYARGNSAPIGAAYRFGGSDEAAYAHFGMIGGGVHTNVSESGAIDAYGTATVVVEDVDFGSGTDDNEGFDVGGCNGDFGPGSSFVYWPDGGIYCEDE